MANDILTYDQKLELLDAAEEKPVFSGSYISDAQKLELLDAEIAERKAQKEAKYAEEEHGVVGEFVAGLGRGALRVAATPFELADVAGEAVGWEGLERVGEAGAEGIEEYIEESPRLRRSESISKNILNAPELWTDPNWYASLVGEGLPTILSMLIPGMAAGKVAKVAGLTKKGIRAAQIAGGLGAATALEAGGAAENIRQYEKRTGKAVPIGTKLQAVIGTGVVAGGLEFVPIFAIFGKAGGKKLISRILKGMIAEGSTEGAQELVANAFAQAGYDPDQRMVDGVVESIVGGVLLGGGMGTISKATSEATNFMEKVEEVDPNEVVEILEQAEEEQTLAEEQQEEIDRLWAEGEEEYRRSAEGRQEAIEEEMPSKPDTPMTSISEETERVARHYMKPERAEKRIGGFKRIAGPGVVIGEVPRKTPELLTAEGVPVDIAAREEELRAKDPALYDAEDMAFLQWLKREEIESAVLPAPSPSPMRAFGIRAKPTPAPKKTDVALEGEGVADYLREEDRNRLFGRMVAEEIKDLSDAEIERVFGAPGMGGMLTLTKKLRDEGLTIEEVYGKEPEPVDIGTAGALNSIGLSNFFQDKIRTGETGLNKVKLQTMIAEQLGISRSEMIKDATFQHKPIEEAFEYAIVKHAKELISKGGTRKDVYGKLKKLYDDQPALATRTSTSIENQAYSTPVHLAYLMQELAGVTKNISVYEPAAGTGMLFTAADPMRVVANEIEQGRLNILSDQELGAVSNLDGADAVGRGHAQTPPKSVDAVIANPPFGTIPMESIRGYRINKLEHKIIINALDAMKDDGKAAFIIGGTNFNDKGKLHDNQRTFLNFLHNNYNVVANILIPGAEYGRQGASFPIRVIAVNGRKAKPEGWAPQNKEAYQEVLNINAILPLVKEIVDNGKNLMVAEGVGEVRAGEEGARPAGTPEGEGKPGELPPVLPGEGAGTRPQRPRIPGITPNIPAPTGVPLPAGEGEPGVGVGEHGVRGGVEKPGAVPETLPEGEVEVGGIEGELGPGGRIRGKPEGVREGVEEPDTGRVPGVGDVDQTIDNLLKLSKEEAEKARKDEIKQQREEGYKEIQEGIKKFNEILGEEGAVQLGEEPKIDQKKWDQLRDALRQIWEGFKKVAKSIESAAEMFIKDAYAKLHSRGKPYIDKFIREDIRAELETEQKAKKEKPKPKKEEVAETEYQTAYIPKSKGPIIDETLIPRKMVESTSEALDKLESEVGNIDEYVAKKLKTTVDKLWKGLAGDQVDAVALSIYNIDNGAGMIEGDQTGVGKGRVAASIWKYARILGKKPIFFTAKPELFTDFYRDMVDIGYHFHPFIMASQPVKARILDKNGKVVQKILSSTERNEMYRDLERQGIDALGDEYDGIVTNYSQINVVNRQQAALHPAFRDNIIILDESHKAAGPDSNTGNFIRHALSDVKGVVYLSATFAKRPDTMPVYYKTDMSQANLDMEHLISAVEAGGTPLMEILSNGLAKLGQLVRREKSFKGVDVRTFTDTENIKRDETRSDAMTDIMRDVIDTDIVIANVIAKAVRKARARPGRPGRDIQVFGITIPGGAIMEGGHPISSTVNRANFAATAHNAVRQLLLSMKCDLAVRKTLDDLKERSHIEEIKGGYTIVNEDGRYIFKDVDNEPIVMTKEESDMSVAPKGRKPVISLDHTMGAFMDYLETEGEIYLDGPFNIGYETVLNRNLDRALTLRITDPYGVTTTHRIDVNHEDFPEPLRDKVNAARNKIRSTVAGLPGSPIDYLKSELKKAGYVAGEITGRRLVADITDPDNWILASRPGGERAAKKEMLRAFNDGKIDVLVVNRSAAEGISAHAHPSTGRDLRPRAFVGLQPQLNVDDEVQLMGRLHRKGQVALPKYLTLFLDIPAELRPASVLMAKMKSLSANTSANSDSPLAQKTLPDMNNRYGDRVTNQWVTSNPLIASVLNIGNADGFIAISGRIAMQPVPIQRDFFEEIELEYKLLIEEMKAQGTYDLEVQDINYKANTLEKSLLTQGRDEDHPFGKSTYREKLNVISPVKPYKSDRIKELIDNKLKKESKEEYKQRIMNAISVGTDQYIEQKRKEAEEAERDFNVSPFETARRVTLNELDHVTIGDTYYIQLENVPNMLGVLIDIKHAKGRGNPSAPSRTRFEFAVNNALRRVTVPISKILNNSSSIRYTEGGIPDNWDDTVSGDMRHVRYMLTGNLLQGFADAPDASKIIRFTRFKGELEEGILLPMNYDPATDTQEDRVRMLPDQAMKIFKADYPLNGSTVGITTGRVVHVPISRAVGGNYYLDDTLKSLTVTGEFESISGRMEATIKEGDENLRKFIDRVYELGDTFTATRNIFNDVVGNEVDQARDRIGDALKDQRGSFSFETKESRPIFDDLVTIGRDVYQRGYKTLQTFSAQMKKILGDLWENIKHIAKELYERSKEILKSERGAVTIRETGEQERIEKAMAVLGIKPKRKRKPGAPLPKRARSVGLAYQNISREAKRLEVEMGLKYPKKTRTHEQLRKRADKIMQDRDKLLKTLMKKKGFDEDEGLVIRRSAAQGLETFMAMVETGDLEKINKMAKVFKEGIGHRLQDLHNEFGRHLESLKEEVSPESMTKAFAGLERDLNKDDMVRFNAALEALQLDNAKPMASFIKHLKNTKEDPKIMDYVYEYWYNSILSGIPTHVVNTASNTAWAAWQIGVHKPLLAAIDPLVAKFQKRQTEYYLDEVIPMLAGIRKGYEPGKKGFKEVVKKGYTTDAQIDKWMLEMGKSVGAFSRSPNKYLKMIAPVISFPTRVLRGMDVWAKQMNYQAELNAIATRMEKKGEGKFEDLVKVPTEEMMAEAAQFADYTTFMNELGTIGKKIEVLRGTIPGGRFIMPFVRTIANLVKRGVEMTPGVGALKFLGGKVKGPEVTQVLVKQIEGAIIALIIASMFDDDKITGDVPANKAEREAFYRQGKKPWSIKLGNRWYQYRRIEPFNTPIASIGILYDTWKRTGEEISTEFAWRASASFVNNVIDSSYLSGLTQVLDSVRKADKWPQKLTNMFDKTAASFSPFSSFQRSFVRAIEAIDKEGAVVRKPKGAWETLKAATPWASVGVTPRKNVWGEDVVIPGTWLEQWLPWKTAKETADKVEIEIERLNSLGLIPYPGMPAKYMSIKGERIDLDDEQFDALVTESGKAVKKRLDNLVGTAYWKMLSDKEKTSRIQRIIRTERKKSRNKIKRQLGKGIFTTPWGTTEKPAWQKSMGLDKKPAWQQNITL